MTPRLAPLLLGALALTACGGSSSGTQTTATNIVGPRALTVTAAASEDGQPISGATLTVEQGVTITRTTSAGGNVSIASSEGLVTTPLTLTAQAAGREELVIVGLNGGSATIELAPLVTPAPIPITVRANNLPTPLPAMSPGAPAVAEVSATTTAATLPAGLAAAGASSELTAFMQPSAAFAIPTVRDRAEVLTAAVVDLSVPGPNGSAHPIYFAIAAFDTGIPSSATEVSLDFQLVSGATPPIEGTILSSADFDLATDTISLRPVADTGRAGLVTIGGVHSGNTITGTGQMASFGFAGAQLDFLFTYDSSFRNSYALECVVTNGTDTVTQYIRGSVFTLPNPADFVLRSTIGALTASASATPLITWSHADAPGAFGFYELVIRGGGRRLRILLPGDASAYQLPSALALAGATTYSIDLTAVFSPSPDLATAAAREPNRHASDLVRRATTLTLP